jgi:hypothetical protein
LGANAIVAVQKAPQSARICTAMRGMRPASLALAYGLAVGLALVQPVVAAPVSLRDMLFPPNGAASNRSPQVARYVDEGGSIAFVLDRSSPTTLLRFDDSPEIWVLTPHTGPGGDVIYKNDMGEPVLRATKLGGLTLFTDGRPGGMAAALVGEAPALRPTAILTPNALLQHLAQSSAHASRAAQHLVVFDAPDVTAQSASIIADAATIAAEAIGGMTRRADGRRYLAKLTKVLLVPGRKSQASMTNGVLQIVVTAKPTTLKDDVSGRPSSRLIDAVLTR